MSALLSWSELDEPRRDRCPRCSTRVPAWRWVRADGLRVLTHDGNTLCPADPTFGTLTGPELAPTARPLAVAA
ncbi:hypothetical protein [Kitasatospora sp. NPDC090308]|uniref:hypothetical protein n=1 Tax=Kitasatospora sp. NPDC090308 TaxID=3364082 RepID=UPI00382B735E